MANNCATINAKPLLATLLLLTFVIFELDYTLVRCTVHVAIDLTRIFGKVFTIKKSINSDVFERYSFIRKCMDVSADREKRETQPPNFCIGAEMRSIHDTSILTGILFLQ